MNIINFKNSIRHFAKEINIMSIKTFKNSIRHFAKEIKIMSIKTMNIKFFQILNISMIKRTLIIFTLLLFTAFGCKTRDTEEATFSYACPNGDPFATGDAPSNGAPGCETCDAGYHVAAGGARCDANTYNASR